MLNHVDWYIVSGVSKDFLDFLGLKWTHSFPLCRLQFASSGKPTRESHISPVSDSLTKFLSLLSIA